MDEIEIVRKLVERVDVTQNTRFKEELLNILHRLDMKMDLINQKLDKVIKEEINSVEIKEIHLKLLNILDGWMSTSDLARIMNYRQEYISRKVAELRKMELVEEKRDGKSILYRRAQNPDTVSM
ncbi:MAG: hypothetical protein DRP11_04760 [Candidatus Aenigmatarchaeota archaeon]|nr:MAG: hypothetical protein DRP11_04760 [Candidatus Aenigmarchaeota archaeon]